MTLVRLHQEMAGPVSPDDLREAMHLSASRLTALVNLLEQAGALLETADGLLEPVGELDAVAAAREAMLLAEAHRRVEQSRVEMMRGYADTRAAAGSTSCPTSASTSPSRAATATPAPPALPRQPARPRTRPTPCCPRCVTPSGAAGW